VSDKTTGRAPDGTPPVFAVHPRILQAATFPPFDLYVRPAGTDAWALFRKANEPVYANTWDKLSRCGVGTCYVRHEDRNRCIDYVEENLPAILAERELPKPQVAEWLYRVLCRATESLFGDSDSYRAYKRVRELVGLLATCLHEDPGMAWDMADCAPLVYSAPTHSVNVSVQLASLAAGSIGVDQPDLLAEVALGGILHDLGKTMVAPGILSKATELTQNEFAQVKRHPRYGLKITAPYLRQSATAQRIIGQHHENACGGGYPDGCSGEAIHVFARAARIVDAFDALTSQRPYGSALDYYRALSTMVNEMRGQFDGDMLRRFIKHLGADGNAVPSVTAAPVAADEEPTAIETLAEGTRPERSAEHSTAIIQFGDPSPAPVASARQATKKAPPAPPKARPVVVAASSIEDEPIEDTSLVSGILSALQNALQGPFGEAVRAAAKPPPKVTTTDAAHQAERETEIESARAIFPVVWQTDEWRGQFAGMTAANPEARRLTSDVLGLLGSLREALARLLEANHVEIVETAAAEPRRTSAQDAAGKRPPYARVGFLYRGDGVEVLEPARVDLQPDRRMAG
jgi:response regulator RpfG family c-di-GMP phosphodiesterase